MPSASESCEPSSCIDDVCRSAGECAWPPQPYTDCECQEEDHGLFVCQCGCHRGIWEGGGEGAVTTPDGGYKLLLVPDDRIEQTEAEKVAGQAWVTNHNRHGLACLGPFEVIAHVGEERRILPAQREPSAEELRQFCDDFNKATQDRYAVRVLPAGTGDLYLSREELALALQVRRGIGEDG